MTLDPEIRKRFDQTFMQLLAAVRVEVLEAKPPVFAASSEVAKMFFKESQKSVLQDLAHLTAAWNSSEIDLNAVTRAFKTLEDMGLETAKERISKLRELETMTK
jgi:hypothetical protein